MDYNLSQKNRIDSKGSKKISYKKQIVFFIDKLLRYAGAPIDFERVDINASTTDPATMENALLSVRRNGVAIKGKWHPDFRLFSFFLSQSIKLQK